MAKVSEKAGSAETAAPKRNGGRPRKPSADAARTRKAYVERLVAATGDTPRTLGKLFDEVGVPIDRSMVRALARRVLVLARNPSALDLVELAEVPVVTRAAAAEALADDDVLVALLHRLAHTRKARAHTFTELIEAVPTHQKVPFRSALNARNKDRRWPPGVGAIGAARNVLVFLLADVVGIDAVPPAAVPPAAEPPAKAAAPTPTAEPPAFERAFDVAFEALKGPRGLNLVSLSALRRALSAWDREGFDRELGALRTADRVVLHTFDGRHGKLDPEESAGAIVEGGRRFVYAARREP